jgi:hypothetical protein
MCSVLYLENIKGWREKYFTVHLLMRGNKHLLKMSLTGVLVETEFHQFWISTKKM